jgi:hypothetical protein
VAFLVVVMVHKQRLVMDLLDLVTVHLSVVAEPTVVVLALMALAVLEVVVH